MASNHIVHHFQHIRMIDDPARSDIVAALLDERGKTGFLFRGVPNGLRNKPRAAAPLLGNNLVNQFKRLRVDARRNNGMLRHSLHVSFVYK